MITTDEASTGAVVARPPWWRRKVGIVSCVVAALVILGTVATLIIVHLIPPAKLVPGLDDDPPDPAKGVNSESLPTRSDVVSVWPTSLCATRDVTITSVSLYKPSSGIVLARWGLQNHGTDGQYGELPASLAHFGHYTSRTITDHCNDSTEYAGVGLELHLTRPGTQSFLGVRMTYQSDGRQRVGYVWVQVTIHRPSTR